VNVILANVLSVVIMYVILPNAVLVIDVLLNGICSAFNTSLAILINVILLNLILPNVIPLNAVLSNVIFHFIKSEFFFLPKIIRFKI
jgi:hypothetical protein